MPTLDRLTPASLLELKALAALMSEVYEDYPVPMHVDAGTLAFMQEALDLVPEASRVAWQDERPVGVALLGLRGEHAWVGGMGVVPAARRAGLGERLMREILAAAREAGAREVRLEVLEQNLAARALYEKLGFTFLRRLEVWTWRDAPPTPARVAEASDPRAVRRRLAAAARVREPWQRSDETVSRLDVSTPALRAVSTPGGDALYRVTDGRASVLQLRAGDAATAGVLLDTIRSRAGVTLLRYLNVPAEDPAVPALRERSATCDATQAEMSLALTGAAPARPRARGAGR